MGGCTIGYLTSVYPAISHTFIFREIRELRRNGLVVKTASMRVPDVLERMTPEEQAEFGATHYINTIPRLKILAVHARLLLTRPAAWFGTLRYAFDLRRRGPVPVGKLLAYFVQAGLLLDWMRREGIGHLHVHFGNPPATAALIALHAGGAPFSLSIHGPDIFNEERESLLAEKLDKAVFVRCISHFCRSQVMRLAAFPQWQKFHIVRCGVDVSTFNPRPAPGNDVPEIVCLGRLCTAKGQHVLLQACSLLRARGRSFHVTFIGDGPERTALESATDSLALRDAVTFEGAVGQDKVRAFLDRADMMVLPSFAEGLPVVLMEAMAKEVPCVSTRIMGIPELIEDGVNGFLTPASDADALAERIERLLDDPALGAEMGRRGRLTVTGSYDIGVNGRAMHDLFSAYAPEALRTTAGTAP